MVSLLGTPSPQSIPCGSPECKDPENFLLCGTCRQASCLLQTMGRFTLWTLQESSSLEILIRQYVSLLQLRKSSKMARGTTLTTSRTARSTGVWTGAVQPPCLLMSQNVVHLSFGFPCFGPCFVQHDMHKESATTNQGTFSYLGVHAPPTFSFPFLMSSRTSTARVTSGGKLPTIHGASLQTPLILSVPPGAFTESVDARQQLH